VKYKITKEYELVIEKRLGKVTHEFEAVQFINKIDSALPNDYAKWFDYYPWWLEEYMENCYFKFFSDSKFIMNFGWDVSDCEDEDSAHNGLYSTYSVELGNYIVANMTTGTRRSDGKQVPYVRWFDIYDSYEQMMNGANKNPFIKQPQTIVAYNFGTIGFKEINSKLDKSPLIRHDYTNKGE